MLFDAILEKYRQQAFSERDKSHQFERLMQGYQLTEPLYANQLKNVWLWEEFPHRKDFGGKEFLVGSGSVSSAPAE